ncbi:MAG TPA: DNA glycosylase [Chthoniobacterales bacterium]
MSVPFEAAQSGLASVQAPGFDLEKTLNSGQVFHWVAHGRGFLGCIGDLPVYLEQSGETVLVKAEHSAEASRYLALDHSVPDILATFPDDPALRTAAEFSGGIRILRQPAWECLGTFITSALKQVRHIRAVSLTIRRRFGKHVSCAGAEAFAYPPAGVLADAGLEALQECKLGFRAKNLLAAAQTVAGGALNLEGLRCLPTDVARQQLCRIPGVGPKIANCVLLFAYERLNVVPVDVWIHRAVAQTYFAGRGRTREQVVQAFTEEYFGPYAGYAQQFLFHHWRMTYRSRASERLG